MRQKLKPVPLLSGLTLSACVGHNCLTQEGPSAYQRTQSVVSDFKVANG